MCRIIDSGRPQSQFVLCFLPSLRTLCRSVVDSYPCIIDKSTHNAEVLSSKKWNFLQSPVRQYFKVWWLTWNMIATFTLPYLNKCAALLCKFPCSSGHSCSNQAQTGVGRDALAQCLTHGQRSLNSGEWRWTYVQAWKGMFCLRQIHPHRTWLVGRAAEEVLLKT